MKIEATDIKTRKLLIMHGGFHPKSSTLRLYKMRKEGCKGLVAIRATIKGETTKIQEHIENMAPSDDLPSECLR